MFGSLVFLLLPCRYWSFTSDLEAAEVFWMESTSCTASRYVNIQAIDKYMCVYVSSRSYDETSGLEVGNNKRATARGCWFSVQENCYFRWSVPQLQQGQITILSAVMSFSHSALGKFYCIFRFPAGLWITRKTGDMFKSISLCKFLKLMCIERRTIVGW